MTKTKYESIIEFIELTNPSRLPNLMRRWCRSKNCTCKYCITTHELQSWSFPDDINCLISHSQQARKISCKFWFQGLMSNTPSTSPDPHNAESDNRIAGVAVLSAHMNRKSRKVRNYREAYLWRLQRNSTTLWRQHECGHTLLSITPKSVRPSPSTLIAVRTCNDSPLTSSAPDCRCRYVYSNVPKICAN